MPDFLEVLEVVRIPCRPRYEFRADTTHITSLTYASFLSLCILWKPSDFWTTRCAQCPAALDTLYQMASDPRYQNVKFISICVDRLDGARDIIEKDDDLRWQNVDHYFMSESDKEKAKKELGFKSVPFCVVMDKYGAVAQMGEPHTIDFNDVPGVVRPQVVPPIDGDGEKDEDQGICTVLEQDFSNQILKELLPMERIFILDHEYFWSDDTLSQISEEEAHTIEFDDFPGMKRPQFVLPNVEDEKNEEDQGICMVLEHDFSSQILKEPPPIERVFILDHEYFWSDGTLSRIREEEAHTIEFDDVPGVVPPVERVEEKEDDQGIRMVFEQDFSNQILKEPPPTERVFILDDDF